MVQALPARTSATDSTAARALASARWTYFSVVAGWRWPRSCPITRMEIPWSMATLANVCRQSWRRTSSRPAALRTVTQSGWRARRPDCGPVKTRRCLRGSASRSARAGAASHTVRGPVLLSSRNSFPSRVVRPLEVEDLALAAAGEQEQADGRRGDWPAPGVAIQGGAQPAELLRPEEAFPAAPPVAPDPVAGVAAFGPVPVDLGLTEDHRQDRQRAVGGGRGGAKRCEPRPDVPAGDGGDRRAPEPREDVLAAIAPGDRKSAGLPAAPVALEHFVGNDFEWQGGCVRAPRRPARTAAAFARATATGIVAASPQSCHVRMPSCWTWRKKRFRPEGAMRTPNPRSSGSRREYACRRGRARSTWAWRRAEWGMVFLDGLLYSGKCNWALLHSGACNREENITPSQILRIEDALAEL